jgi:glycosyltransferase involved in cell wall biosynthesis
MSEPLRILIALTYYRPHYSGLTIYAEREARALAQRGHEVTVLTSRFDPNLPERERIDGVEIVRLNVGLRLSKGVLMPAMPLSAWRLAQQADVIHLHVPQFDAALIALIGRALGKPVVLTYHCDMRLPPGFVHYLANQASHLANHIAARAAHVIVHNTREYAESSSFLQPYLDKLQPIFPPVEVAAIKPADLEAFRARFDIHPGQRIIGMAARLATEKGVEVLVQALPLVLERFPTARVLFVGPHERVVGEEAYAARLAPLIEQVGAHWSFLGVLSDREMAAFFQTCEVTVLPSINPTESFGMVQVESLACGTPVIASDLPGVRIPVQMTGMGALIPAGNAVALAQAIIGVLESAPLGHPEALIALSTPEAVAQAYESIFDLARRRAGSESSPYDREGKLR